MDGRALSELRRLAEHDAELTRRAAELRRLDQEVAAIRAGTEAVQSFLDTHPDEALRRADELKAAGGELAGRRAQLAEAEREVAKAAGDDEAVAHAERARTRAADHAAVAQARVDRAEAAVADLERDAAQVPARLPELVERARHIGEGMTPPTAASELVEWAAHAHAELFVATRQIDAQRERLIREANELASSLLGEPTYGATAAQALARAEAHWVSSPGHVSESR